jgi:AcrR family transcriptional regulator
MKPVASRTERAARTRESILLAARQVIVARGYHGAGLDQVAAEAGLTRVTVHRQFGTKQGLLAALADDLAARSGVVAAVRAARRAADPAAACAGTVRALCRLWAVDPDLMRRLVGLAAVDPELAPVVADRERWRHRQVAGCVRRLAVAGLLRPGVDTSTALAAARAVTAFFTWDELAGAGDPERAARTVLRLLAVVVDLDAAG